MDNSSNCQQLLTIETISVAFKNNQRNLSDRIISCFYSCYQLLFIKWAKITYAHYPADIIEFAAGSSFTDGVLKLKESASYNKLYKGRASVKTVLFHYCRNMLLSHLKNENRLAEKNRKLQLVIPNETEDNTGETESEIKEKKHQLIMQALEKMAAADRQIIQWRHIEGKSSDEIARLLDIKAISVTNRIYRCMQRLKEGVEKIEKEQGGEG